VKFLGGLLGMIWAKRLHVSILAVQEPFRDKGYGTELMRRAEQYAIEREGTGAWLSTFSLQARPFYERLCALRYAGGLPVGPLAIFHDQAADAVIMERRDE
jgi:GNAT superfamily N-acetyltransferase